MKTKKLFFIFLLSLFISPVLVAEDQNREISADEALKYYCHTWINPDYYKKLNYTGIKKYNKDSTFEWHRNETVGYPSNSGTFKIEKSWIDKDGIVWINVNLHFMGIDHHFLAKISDGGNKLEQMYSYPYPAEIDPNHKSYHIMYKK